MLQCSSSKVGEQEAIENSMEYDDFEVAYLRQVETM